MRLNTFVIYKKNERSSLGSYDYQSANDIKINLIGTFLTSDVRGYVKDIKAMLLDNNCRGITGNLTFISKEGEWGVMSNHYSEQPDRGPFIKILITDLVKLLDEWDEVYARKPHKITITFDGQHYAVTGTD